MSTEATPRTKKGTVQIDGKLLGYLRLLKALPGVEKDINEMLEPGGWDFVRQHREQLERALGEAIEIPEPAQEALALK